MLGFEDNANQCPGLAGAFHSSATDLILFRGAPALTSFRLQQLLTRLQKINPAVKSIDADFVFFVEAAEKLSSTQVNQLEALLPRARQYQYEEGVDDFSVWVIPRIGTISPWSSKATEIAKGCEVKSVNRIERGIHYIIRGISHLLLNNQDEKYSRHTHPHK